MALLVKIGADMRSYDKKMRTLTKDIGYVGKKFQNVGATMTKAITIPAIGLGAAATKIGMGFEASMSEVQAISGATGEELRKLEDAAREMGKKTKFSASESADALKYLALAGYDAESSIKALPDVLNLASAGGMDLAYTSDLITDSMAALKLDMSELTGFTDKLAKTSQKSNTSVEQLGEAILTVGGTANLLKGGTTELSTALGILADNGIKGAEGGTKLRNMILSLTAPTDQAKEAIKNLGIDIFDSEGNMRSMNDIMMDFGDKLGSLSDEDKANALSDIFNKADLKGVEALLGGAGERFNELSGQIDSSSGAAQKMADVMNDNLQGRLKELKSKLEDLAIKAFDKLQPKIEKIIEAIGKFTDKLSGMSDKQFDAMLKIIGFAAALGPVLLGVGKMITIFGKAKAAFTLLKGGAVALGGGIGAISLPVIGAVTAIAGLIATGVLIWKNWDKIKEKASEIWGSIKEKLSDIMGSISGFFSEKIEKIKGFFTGLKDSIVGIFKNISDFISNWRSPNADIPEELRGFTQSGSGSGYGLGGAIKGGDINVNVTGNHIASDYDVEMIGKMMAKQLKTSGAISY
jgi:TP901 family phage tail tape measure protein